MHIRRVKQLQGTTYIGVMIYMMIEYIYIAKNYMHIYINVRNKYNV
jgi:hypothetical protein